MTEYASFRQRLDAVLRTLDVKQVQDFLIAEGQWQPGQPANPEFAMWMMIAGTPTLQELHERARKWLETHGHEEETRIFLARDKRPQGKQGKGKSSSGFKNNKSQSSSKRKK